MTRRVLNLIDQPGPTAPTPLLHLTAELARLDEAAGAVRHAWLLIGGEAMRDAARAAGIDDDRARLMPMPTGIRRFVPRALGPIARLLDQADHADCWTEGATRLASAVGCAHAVPRYAQATYSPLTRRTIAPLAEAVLDEALSLRAQVRGRWGTPDEAIVLGVLADRPDQVDVGALLLASAFSHEILHASDAPRHDIRIVCHPQAAGRMGAIQLSELLKFPQMLIQDARIAEPWRTLPGCDAVVAPDPAHAGLSLVWAEALGLPIIAPPSPSMPGLASIYQLTLAQSASARHLAQPITDWAQTHAQTPLTLVS